MKSKPPAASLGEEDNMSTVLELTSTFICYVLGKKDISCSERIYMATDNGGKKI